MSEGVAQTVEMSPLLVVQTPYVLARNSHHLFSMATPYDGGKEFPLARLYVLCASIELGLKAAMLAKDCTPEHKARMKRLGHNLVAVYEAFQADTGASILDSNQIEALSKIDNFFKNKGIEYFNVDVLTEMIKSFGGFPDRVVIENVAKLVNNLLVEKELFRDAYSSVTPMGLITFV